MLALCNKILFLFYSTWLSYSLPLWCFVGSAVFSKARGWQAVHHTTPREEVWPLQCGLVPLIGGHCGKKIDMALHNSIKSLPVYFSFSPSNSVQEKVADWFWHALNTPPSCYCPSLKRAGFCLEPWREIELLRRVRKLYQCIYLKYKLDQFSENK